MASASDNPLALLADRRFAFYPAIRNIEHNEWTLERETWSEILARNVASGGEIWIPRSHLGEISSSDSPVLIVGLKRELELKAGTVFPYRSPVAAIPGPRLRRDSDAAEPEPPPPSRSNSDAESKTFRLIARAVGVGVLLSLALLYVGFRGVPNPIAALFRTDSSTADQRYLGLTRQDRYPDVASKLGPPEEERWLSDVAAELQFQALRYPSRRYVVILMGPSREDVRYLGALHDSSRKLLDSARLPGGGDASALMRNLPGY